VTAFTKIIRPHRIISYMRLIVTDRVAWSVGRSAVAVVSPAKTAEPIEMPFAIWTGVGPRKRVDCGVHTGAT